MKHIEIIRLNIISKTIQLTQRELPNIMLKYCPNGFKHSSLTQCYFSLNMQNQSRVQPNFAIRGEKNRKVKHHIFPHYEVK